MWATCINTHPDASLQVQGSDLNITGKCRGGGGYRVVAAALLTPAGVFLSHVGPHHLVQLATV